MFSSAETSAGAAITNRKGNHNAAIRATALGLIIIARPPLLIVHGKR
jgi:hypothetical protein